MFEESSVLSNCVLQLAYSEVSPCVPQITMNEWPIFLNSMESSCNLKSSRDNNVHSLYAVPVCDGLARSARLITVVGFFFVRVGWDWVHLVHRPLFGVLYQLRMIDDECEAVGGMRIDRGNRNSRRKPTPVPQCPPQIPHYLTWAWTRAAAVGSRRLTACAMARPLWDP
jgi:hypothetical protein